MSPGQFTVGPTFPLRGKMYKYLPDITFFFSSITRLGNLLYSPNMDLQGIEWWHFQIPYRTMAVHVSALKPVLSDSFPLSKHSFLKWSLKRFSRI